MMSGMLIAVLFWLFIPLSLLVSAIGVSKSKYGFVILGAVLFFPMAYYLNGSPSLHGFAILLPLFQIGSAAAVRENNKFWAWLLLAPPLLSVLWFLVVIVLYQIS
jgi:hypothetical protein